MKKSTTITHLFLDIGGVILTNGWDHESRKQAAKKFKIDYNEMERRHQLTFGTYEEGEIKLNEYLDRVVFFKKRSFTHDQFRLFMFAQSKPYPEMIELFSELKKRHDLKIVVINNEARELNVYRIKKFKLKKFVDLFISSCFVNLRKPDKEIFRRALDISQVKPKNIIYIENTAMYIEIAKSLHIPSILHTDYKSTREKLDSLGLCYD